MCENIIWAIHQRVTWSDWLLFNAKWGMFQLYHGEKKLYFDERMMMMMGLNESGSWITYQLLQVLSRIRRGFTPGFLNYNKECTRLAASSDKVYQLLTHGRWFSPGTLASSTTKTGRHDIAESGIKHNKLNHINNALSWIFIVLAQRNNSSWVDIGHNILIPSQPVFPLTLN